MDWKNKPRHIFNKVKAQMFAKGVENFYALDLFIRQFDPENSGILTPHFFNLFCNKIGVFLTTQELRTIIQWYCRQNKQSIHYREFLQDIKYSIPQRIVNLVNQAFDRLTEKQGQTEVSLERLFALYRADHHPRVKTRILTPEQAMQIFKRGMKRKSFNQMVSKEAFIDYYAQLNFCIPEQRQTFFEDMIIQTWNLVHPDDYVSNQRLRQIQLILYEKIREKSDGKTNEWKTAKKVLSYFDLDDCGKCSLEDFSKALEKFGCAFKDYQIKALFDKYVSNDCEQINNEYFSKSIMNLDISGMSSKPNIFMQTMGKNHFTLTK